MSRFSGSPQTPKFRSFKQRTRTGKLLCDGCNIDTSPDEDSCSDYYMVTSKVWCEEAGLPTENCMLCRHCLSVRLGRVLVREDYIDAPVNWFILADEFGVDLRPLQEAHVRRFPGYYR